MNFQKIKKNYQSFGFYNFLLHSLVRISRFATYSNILVCMTLTEDSLNAKSLEVDSRYSCRFLSDEEIRFYAEDPANDLPKDFVDLALSHSDLCFAILDGDKLASYGWYTKRAATFLPTIDIHFDPAWIYMYRGCTLPAYRGQRLHAVGMAHAMKIFVSKGSKGLISYVEASNFDSLRSVFRMGYSAIGKIFVIKILGRYLSFSSGDCSKFGLCLKSNKSEIAKAGLLSASSAG